MRTYTHSEKAKRDQAGGEAKNKKRFRWDGKERLKLGEGEHYI